MLTTILTWYLILQLLFLAGLPLAFAWMRGLPSRGYTAAKALGLLLTGVLLWWGNIAHLWSNNIAAAITAAILLFAVGLTAMRGRWAELPAWWREHRPFVFTAEALFALAFIAWTAVRASQPQLETAGGEKWMEIAFLNATLRSPTLPPHDPWLSGFAISYYYLGYLLMSLVTRLAAVPSTIAFTLANAGWFALVAVGAYGIVYDLLNGEFHYRPLLGPLMLLITGNGEGFLEVLHARGLLPAAFWRWLDIRNLNTPPRPPFTWRPTRFFWWWQASRTLHDYTPWGADQEVIDEFPAFSFLLGDMHPHLLALPFVLLAIALALDLYRRWQPQSSWRHRLLLVSGHALILGALGFLNTWDFPIYWALMIGAIGLATLSRSRPPTSHAELETPTPALAALNNATNAIWAVLPEAAFLATGSVIAYLPFWWALRSQAGGILPNLFNATRLPQFIVMFTPMLIPVAGLLITEARRARVGLGSTLAWSLLLLLVTTALGAAITLLSGSPYVQAFLRGETIQGIPARTLTDALIRRLLNPWTAWLLAAGVAAALLALFGHRPPERERAFPLLMALIGLLLTLTPEFIYLQDVFLIRMNTIFKFYFQAWTLWSLAGAWQLSHWLGGNTEDAVTQAGPRRRPALALAAWGMIAIGLVYPLFAIPTRAEEHGIPWTLDGAAWLAEAHPDDYAAIRWLNAHIDGRPIIVETPGDRRRAYTYEGRISALTGLPTVLGWADHERQWRGVDAEQNRRAQDLETLFTTTDLHTARNILTRYGVSYVYIGPTERARYPADGLAKFDKAFPAVYRAEGVTIYRIPSEK